MPKRGRFSRGSTTQHSKKIEKTSEFVVKPFLEKREPLTTMQQDAAGDFDNLVFRAFVEVQDSA
ncbi:MAG: hypothetical protein ACOX2W_15410 [Desulfomonilia bacterium]|nr:hypothetical protein [Desulfomonilia bacterium]